MINTIKDNFDNIIGMFSTGIGIAGDIITVISIVNTINYNNNNNNIETSDKILLAVCTLLLFFGIFYLSYKNTRLVNKWNGLAMLANRGHIHTVEMILMMHYQFYLNKNDIMVQKNNFKIKSADFYFDISKRNGNISDVHHRNCFVPGSRIKKETYLNFWIFGEGDSKPSECYIEGNKRIVLKPYAVNNLFFNYPKNENIFSIECNMDAIKDDTKITFSYMRYQSYDWSKGGTFIIYPKCFASKIKKASFNVEFEGNLLNQINIRFTELFCGGRKPKANEIAIEKYEIESNRTIYKTKRIKVNVNNVYVIKIIDITQ